MNLSRAYTLDFDEDLSVGRVQTPTLAMLVERELAIRAFVPEDYLEVVATFSPTARRDRATKGPGSGDEAATAEAKRLQGGQATCPDGRGGRRASSSARAPGSAAIESVDAPRRKRMPPPLLYDLTELQRHANRLYGFSAQRTLELAQALYEQHKLISYPRTDSRHLSTDVAAHAAARSCSAIAGALPRAARPRHRRAAARPPLRRRRQGHRPPRDHPHDDRAGGRIADRRRAEDLRPRLPAAALGLARRPRLVRDDRDHRASPPPPDRRSVDRYHSTGTAVEQVGWKVLDLGTGSKEQEGQTTRASRSARISRRPGAGAAAGRCSTRRPSPSRPGRRKRFTEATLLTAMETAGKTLDEKELSDAMKERGLGTPATRAAIIETLLRREYIERQGKTLEATDKGIRLIEVVHPDVKSPAMTGQWEAQLARIQRGEAELGGFMKGIEEYVREVVGEAAHRPAPARTGTPARPGAAERHGAGPDGTRLSAATPPSPAGPGCGCERRRACGPGAANGSRKSAARRLRLPLLPPLPGSGLPGRRGGQGRAAGDADRRGQVALLPAPRPRARRHDAGGQPAHRADGGPGRASSRRWGCAPSASTRAATAPPRARSAWTTSTARLDFLFIAPERLRVPGLPRDARASASRRWSRSTRRTASRNGGTTSGPTTGCSASAFRCSAPRPSSRSPRPPRRSCRTTSSASSGSDARTRFIHGFRRDNIAIEVVEMPPSERARRRAPHPRGPGAPARHRLRADAARRPRRSATSCGSDFPAAAYHAGMTRERPRPRADRRSSRAGSR